MENGNYPHGYREEQPNHFQMPEAKPVERVYKSLPWQPRQNGTQEGINALKASLMRSSDEMAIYKEYATIEQSFETFCDQMVETLGENWVFKLSRKSKDRF